MSEGFQRAVTTAGAPHAPREPLLHQLAAILSTLSQCKDLIDSVASKAYGVNPNPPERGEITDSPASVSGFIMDIRSDVMRIHDALNQINAELG
jgi:hypothetical protein